MTLTRAGDATCTKGNTLTGISDGDLVVCGTNQARVMVGGSGEGVPGVMVEAGTTNNLVRSAELCDAAWSDVGTPSCSSDAATGPWGTATMDQITDNDVGALEGRSQAITNSTLAVHTASCYVKAGTASSATIMLVGTGNSAGDCTGTATGLSTTTSTRISCVSSAAYAAGLTAVTVSIKVGTDVTDQGTLYVESCDHTSNANLPFVSSHIPTVAAAVARAAETPVSFALPTAIVPAGIYSMSARYNSQRTTAAAWTVIQLATTGTTSPAITMGQTTVSGLQFFCRTQNAGDGATLTAGGGSPITGPYSTVSSWCANDGTSLYGERQGTSVSATGVRTMPAAQTLNITGSTTQVNGVISRVCVDPDPNRCR